MSKNKTTKLSSTQNFDVNNIIFSDPIETKIPGTKLSYKRINISVQYDDGSIGDLIIPTSKVYSYGVQENKDQITGKINGYTLPMCLWNKNGPSTEEKQFTDVINDITEHCKQHLINIKESIGNYDLEMRDLKKFNPIYYKKDDKGKIMEGVSPTLYGKLISSKKDSKNNEENSTTSNTKIITLFSNEEGEDIDPFSLLHKRCYVQAAIKFESIYMSGIKYSPQVKVYQAVVEPVETGMKSLLVERKVVSKDIKPKILPTETKEELPSLTRNDQEDTGSLQNSDSEDSPQMKKTSPQLPVSIIQPSKKIVKKVLKK